MKTLYWVVPSLALVACADQNTNEEPAAVPVEVAAEADDDTAVLAISDRIAFEFVTPEKGAAALTEDDRFTENLKSREIGIRTQDPERTSLEDLKDVYGADTLFWSKDQIARLSAIIESKSDKIKAMEHVLPETVYMTLAGVKAAGGLPHTRGETIIFAGGALPGDDDAAERLFWHELHHVLSRHNRDVHNDYYAIIGFEPCVVNVPDALNAQRLTNPDAPTYNHYVPVADADYDGVVPFLFASRDYEAGSETRLPDYFGFGLLTVNVADGECNVTNDLESLLAPNEVPAYFEAIGGNTGYIIHPEETLADNFVNWAMGDAALPNPEIPEAVGAFWTGLEK